MGNFKRPISILCNSNRFTIIIITINLKSNKSIFGSIIILCNINSGYICGREYGTKSISIHIKVNVNLHFL